MTDLKMRARDTLGNLFKQGFLDFDKLWWFNYIQYFFQLSKEHDLKTRKKELNIKPLNHLDQQNADNSQILLQGEMEATLAQQDPLSKNMISSTFNSF